MAKEKVSFTGVISDLTRGDDTKSGWGKYTIGFAGYNDKYPVAVPSDTNAKYNLEPGWQVTIQDGPFDDWILIGEPSVGDSQPQARTQQPQPTGGGSGSGSGNVPAYLKPKGSSAKAQPQPAQTFTGSGKHTPWNEYQINVRDPQMKMQDYLKICKDVHVAVIQSGIDVNPTDIVEAIISDAKLLQSELG